MTDAELQDWWPDLGAVVAALRRVGQAGVADLLVEAVRRGATSGEVLAGIGAILRDHRACRSRLGHPGARAWDAVMGDVSRAYPGPWRGGWPLR